MSDGSFLLSLGILFLVAGAILLAIGHYPQGDGRRRRRWRQRRRAVAPEPCGPAGPLCGPWRCSPSCTHCIKAAQELQQLVLSAWAGTGASATLDAGTWRAAWQDLEELVEQGQLSCHNCSSSGSPESLGPPESLREMCLTRDAGAPVEMSSTRSLGPARVGRVSLALMMHLARKALEKQLETLPVPVQLSQQRAAQQQGCRVLPKVIPPGQSQPLPRRGLCTKANAIADNIKEKEVRRVGGDPNPTKESLPLLAPCPPPLLAPPDLQLPQEHSVWRPRALGQASTVEYTGEGRQEPHSSEEEPAIQPPTLGNVVSESLLRLDRDLPPPDEECLWPFGLAMAPPALPSLDNGAAGPEAGPAAGSASVLPKEDVGHQSDFTTRGGGQADTEDRSWPRAAAPVVISRLELSQEVRGKLWVHTARKCLEIKLQRLPVAVQQSTETLHRSQPKVGQAGAGPLGPCSASPPLLKLKHLIQPDQDTLQQLGASLTCPGAPTTPSSCPAPVPFYGPVPGEGGGQASLEASTLPSTSCSSGDEMGTAAVGAALRTPQGMAPAPGAPQGHRGCCKAQARTAAGSSRYRSAADPPEGTTSTEGAAAPEPRWNEAGHDRQRWRSSRRQRPGTCESSLGSGPCSQGSSSSTDVQGRWTPVGLPQGMPPQKDVPPATLTPSSPEETPSQYGPSLRQHGSAPATRHMCSCHLRPARGAQDTAAVLTGNTLRSVLEKICQRRRKLSPPLESSL